MDMFKEYIAYLKDNPSGYWFKRKLYGWGWTPARWQGWVTVIVFAFLIGFTTALSLHDYRTEGIDWVRFLLPTIVLVGLLIFICYKKGEKPKWQWGKPKQ